MSGALRRHAIPALIDRLVKAERADAQYGEDLRISVVTRAEIRRRRDTARKELDAAIAQVTRIAPPTEKPVVDLSHPCGEDV